MKFTMKSLGSVLVLLSLAACSTVSELQPAEGVSFPPSYSISQILVEDKTGEDHELENGMTVEALMKSAMREAISNSGKLESGGPKLTYEVFVIQYQKGSAAARWLMPGLGKTILSVEGSVKDSTGNVIASTRATESIGAGGGYTIGAWKYIFENVAEKLVDDLP